MESTGRKHRRRLWAVPLVAASLLACEDPIEPSEPDASIAVDAGPPPDAGTVADAGVVVDGGLRIRALNLVPASGRATSADHQLSGGLVPSSSGPATSDRHRLRGRLAPLAPRE